MKIAVIDDYQNAFRTLKCYAKLKDHEMMVYTDTEKEPARLAERLKDAEAVVLTQQRSRFPRAAIERLPKLKLISQTGRATAHIDVEADILSLHLPLNKETQGIVTAADLALMKPSALLANTSRAGLIAQGALVNALKAGRPGMAAVDVYEDEPVLGAAHPLLKMDNVICTPHLDYVEKDTYEDYYGVVVDQIVAYAAGNPINVVNPEVIAKK